MNKRNLVGLALCALLLAVVAGFSYLYQYKQRGAGTMLGQSKLTGTLYLTLNTGNNMAGSNIYTFNLSTKSLAPIFQNGRSNQTPAFSVAGDKLAYASRGVGDTAYQLYGLTTSGQHYFQVTRDANQIKREPVWSSDGAHLAYSVQPPPVAGTSTQNLLLPSNWLVFITDLSQHSNLVGVGADPFFSPDGKTLFALQNNGLRAVSVASVLATSTKTKSSQLVTFGPLLVPPPTGTTTPALKSMKISLSPDGTHLAWSVPTKGFVRIYSIKSWAPLTLVQEKDLPLTALYSTFSPDSKSLALEQVTLDPATKKFVSPKIVIYSLSDYASIQALDLSNYSTAYSGISAWR